MFRASLCPSSGEQDVCYCMWCAALVLLDVVGSGCGALRCGVRAQCSHPTTQRSRGSLRPYLVSMTVPYEKQFNAACISIGLLAENRPTDDVPSRRQLISLPFGGAKHIATSIKQDC